MAGLLVPDLSEPARAQSPAHLSPAFDAVAESRDRAAFLGWPTLNVVHGRGSVVLVYPAAREWTSVESA
jgi:hypothetical protein